MTMPAYYNLRHTSNRTSRAPSGKLQSESLFKVSVRLNGGIVFTHKAEVDKHRAEELRDRMLVDEVHLRSYLEMRQNVHFEPASSSLFVSTYHTGRAGGGKYNYTVYASTEKEIQDWITALYGSWHPQGYGTHAAPVQVVPRVCGHEEGRRGVYTTTASRWGSCD